jgi:hypothetical protein
MGANKGQHEQWLSYKAMFTGWTPEHDFQQEQQLLLFITIECIPTWRPTSLTNNAFFFSMARQPLGGLDRLIFRGFTITLFRHTTLGRTPLDEWSASHRDLYLTTHNTDNRHTSMPPVGFETTILVRERPQTHVLDRTATGIGTKNALNNLNCVHNKIKNK